MNWRHAFIGLHGWQWNTWLTVIEKLAVIGGVILAAFPLYQWWGEAEDRRLDRIGNLIQTAEACERIPNFGLPSWMELPSSPEAPGPVDYERKFEVLAAASREHYMKIRSGLCLELNAYMDAEGVPDFLRQFDAATSRKFDNLDMLGVQPSSRSPEETPGSE